MEYSIQERARAVQSQLISPADQVKGQKTWNAGNNCNFDGLGRKEGESLTKSLRKGLYE